MADATMYTFELREVASALLQKQGITDGQWVLGFEFAFAAIVAGPRAEDARPTALVMVNKVSLGRAELGTPPHLIVDLSTPAPTKLSKARAKKQSPVL